MPKRPCLTPGCPNLAKGGPRGPRCTTCQRAWDRERNARPERQAYKDKGYRSVPLVGRCADCGSVDNLTRDHVKELHEGGTNDPSNLVLRCLTCNLRKSNERRRTSKHSRNPD